MCIKYDLNRNFDINTKVKAYMRSLSWTYTAMTIFLLMLITLLHDIKAFFEVKCPDFNTNTYRVKRKRLMFVCFWSIMSLFISWKIKYLLVLHQRVKKKDFWQEKFLRWFVFQNSGRGPQYVPSTSKRAYQLFVCI